MTRLFSILCTSEAIRSVPKKVLNSVPSPTCDGRVSLFTEPSLTKQVIDESVDHNDNRSDLW